MASWRIHQSLVQKPVSIEDFWPISGDKERVSDKIIMTREMYALIKKNHLKHLN